MLFTVWLLNLNAFGPPYTVSPYAAGTYLGTWFAANATAACQLAATATGNSINSLQAQQVIQSTAFAGRN